MTADNTTQIDQHGALLEAILAQVPFDGWSAAAFGAAARDASISMDRAWVLCPRGAVDLAVTYHRRGDAAMLARLDGVDLDAMRVRERVTFAVRARIEAGDREAVRRGSALFALPQHAVEGARLIWGTADVIWTALGDTSQDANWYSKRAILSGVYTATVLFWLGDESPGQQATWAFLDRRIGDVMTFEKVKAQLRENPLTKGFMGGVEAFLSRIKAPARTARTDLPGRWSGASGES